VSIALDKVELLGMDRPVTWINSFAFEIEVDGAHELWYGPCGSSPLLMHIMYAALSHMSCIISCRDKHTGARLRPFDEDRSHAGPLRPYSLTGLAADPSSVFLGLCPCGEAGPLPDAL
jgi:hypothetical protein